MKKKRRKQIMMMLSKVCCYCILFVFSCIFAISFYRNLFCIVHFSLLFFLYLFFCIFVCNYY